MTNQETKALNISIQIVTFVSIARECAEPFGTSSTSRQTATSRHWHLRPRRMTKLTTSRSAAPLHPHSLPAEHSPPPPENSSSSVILSKHPHSPPSLPSHRGRVLPLPSRRCRRIAFILLRSPKERESRVSRQDQDVAFACPQHERTSERIAVVVASTLHSCLSCFPSFTSPSRPFRHHRVELLLTMASSSDIVARREGSSWAAVISRFACRDS